MILTWPCTLHAAMRNAMAPHAAGYASHDEIPAAGPVRTRRQPEGERAPRRCTTQTMDKATTPNTRPGKQGSSSPEATPQTAERAADVLNPLPRKVNVPMIDAHCHASFLRATALMLKAGTMFGTARWVAIIREPHLEDLRRKFGERLIFNVWLDYSHADDPRRFARENTALIRRVARQGARCIKFWYKPEFNHRTGFYFDDWRLDPIFQAMVDNDLAGLVHIADPDVWYQRVYNDPAKFEPKWATYRQLTNTLGRFAHLRVVVAHMGGNPERLDFLDRLLSTYPNCYLDTSATKWVVRELSPKPVEAREFFLKWSHRLLFGTDLVARKNEPLEHYASRYWVHQFLYEQAGEVTSPIADNDAAGPVCVRGLDLPRPVLERLYLRNAEKFFGVRIG